MPRGSCAAGLPVRSLNILDAPPHTLCSPRRVPPASHWRVSCPACPAGPAEGAGWAAGSISVSDVCGDVSLPAWKRCALSPDFLFVNTRRSTCGRLLGGL